MSCADPKSREDALARKGDTLREFCENAQCCLNTRKMEKSLTG